MKFYSHSHARYRRIMRDSVHHSIIVYGLHSHPESSVPSRYVSAALTHVGWLKLQRFSGDAWRTKFSSKVVLITCTIDQTTVWYSGSAKEILTRRGCGLGIAPTLQLYFLLACGNPTLPARLREEIFESVRVLKP